VSALGAAFLAGLQQKVFKDLDQVSQLSRDKKILQPSGNDKTKTWYEGWKKAVRMGGNAE